MKTGEAVKLICPSIDIIDDDPMRLLSITITKLTKGRYNVETEGGGGCRQKHVWTSAEVRKIIKIAVDADYKMEGKIDAKDEECREA